MNDRQRFAAIMGYQPFDTLPAYYFGLWQETRARWHAEGLRPDRPLTEQVGLDPDWEIGMWETHSLGVYEPQFPGQDRILEEADSYKIIQHPNGSVTKESKLGSSIPEHLKEALEPTRASWDVFRRAFDAGSPLRQPDPAALARKAAELNSRAQTVCCFGGSLYGRPRIWMGTEAISLLSYDDPALYEEIIAYSTDFYITLNRPLLQAIHCEVAYIFEDCCGRSGPLFSPQTYQRFYHPYYRRLVDFYKSCGVKYVLLDSDGFSEPLIQGWLDSGIDIIFPIEVGTWGADPVALRRKFGKSLRMMGGVDKHLITRDPAALRHALERLRPLVEEGGFIPLPDHRIPPDCSLQQFRAYVQMFRAVFARPVPANC